jgi:dephospho-CoA kinase
MRLLPLTGHNKRFTVGLTGGAGSGKTTVSNLFRDLGVDIVDADEISRELVSRGSPLLSQILDHFGQEVTDVTGGLDRRALRVRIFRDAGAKSWLEALLHPEIREETQRRIETGSAPYVIVVVPLLVESGAYEFVNRMLIVDAPEDAQVARLRRRDDISLELAEQMLAAQASRRQRLDRADDVIDNNMSLSTLAARVRKLHETYLQMAADRQFLC